VAGLQHFCQSRLFLPKRVKKGVYGQSAEFICRFRPGACEKPRSRWQLASGFVLISDTAKASSVSEKYHGMGLGKYPTIGVCLLVSPDKTAIWYFVLDKAIACTCG